MSGHLPRFKSLYRISREIKLNVLCPHCDLAPGWGWEARPKDKLWRKGRINMLPPAGNGWVAVGICKHCNGTGLMPISLTEFEQ